ncbi:MAG TPA: cytochrome c [Methylothermaceae bacterium]|nr:cytochrome c [Methylothermaceae bacterium]
MHKQMLILSILAFLGYASASWAADPKVGEQISKTKGCAGCHGAKGISPEGTSYPNLAGQKEAYIVNALKAYRDKTRQAPLMNGMAAGFSDEDIDNLAAYYASLNPCP